MPFKNTYTTFDDVECGLVSIHDGFCLPLYLEKCQVFVEVINHIGHYTIKQSYVNLMDDTLEATYIFPIQEGGAVHYFTAESNGVLIEGKVKKKGDNATASDIDEDDLAMGDNRTAFLLTEFKPDLYQLALGELAPNSITVIELKYVCELPIENNAVKLSIPNTVAPQYSSPPNDCAEKTAADQLVDLDKALDVEITMKVRQTVAFNTEADPHEIEFVAGDAVDEDGFYFSTGSLTLERTAFEEEQIVFVSTVTGKSFGARILIEETSKGEVAAMVTLVPEFPAVDYQSEMIFLVDRSGSMMGRSIEKAKEALHIFLASLPSDCMFNICSFNASFDFLFESVQPYNDKTLADARAYTDNMRAGGGTRVYEPLETIFKQKVGDGCERQIFVLTDGHVSRPSESVEMVGKYKKEGRVFTLGIGEGASRELVNGLARAGKGVALFVTLAEDLKDKVLDLLSRSLLPGLSNITFDWLSDMKPQKSILSIFKTGNPDVGTVMSLGEKSAPNPIPHGFSSQLSIVYQSLEFGNLPVGLRISGTGPNGDVMLVVNLDTTKVMKSELLHKLMARRMVKMLEEDDSMSNDAHVQTRMTNLGTNYNITNKWCSSVSTGQFGTAVKRAPVADEASGASLGEASFMAAPPGMVKSSPNLGYKKKGGLFGGAVKGNKQFKRSVGSAPSFDAPQNRSQVSNTRWAKSKMMSSPSSAPQISQKTKMVNRFMTQSAAPQAANQSAPRGAPLADCARISGGSSLSSEDDDADASLIYVPPANIGKVRDEMLMGFTVLQKTDGSFSFGPAFVKDLNMKDADVDTGSTQLGISKELLLTLIVVIYLRSAMASRKSSWSRIGEKADGFIAANIGETDLSKLEFEVQRFMDRFVKQGRSSVLFKGYKQRK
ncbi:von Willebrand factor A domain-containing protein DDB_G0292740-like [Bolinopsis microptera]|uniref:von Willebrand factor A domain-containing protein DDB_G0292740-like n=1 Tax=Bolinopsis microptera TaxID=2820187 RepID=UPI003079FA62